MKTHRLSGIVAMAVLLAAGGAALAQELEPGPDREPGVRPGAGIVRELLESLYPIGLVKRYADEIKLTDPQKDKLRELVRGARDEVGRLKLDAQKEADKLSDLLRRGASGNEVYAQLDRLLPIENKIKKKHLGLLIGVRDLLTAQQRKALDGFKKEDSKREGPPPDRRGREDRRPDRPPRPPGPPPDRGLDDSF